MFCWQARRRLADLMEAGPGAGLGEARAHVDACQDCKAELQALSGVAELVGSAGLAWPAPGPTPLTDPLAFEQAVFRRARTVMRGEAERPALAAVAEPGVLRWRGLVPVASAAAIMALAVATSLLVGTPSQDGILPPAVATGAGEPDDLVAAGAVAAEDWADRGGPGAVGDDESFDLLAPPREIPFMIREDLVGARRGAIPATTYVLEPAPVESAVMRASL